MLTGLQKQRPYYQHVIDRVVAKLLGWKGQLLSPGDRLILAKHQTMLTYLFSALPPPKSVLQQLELMFSKTLRASFEQQARLVWPSWERLSYPMAENGFGFRRLVDVESFFSCKLWCKWRMGLGLWSSYVNSISIKKSCVYKRIQSVDVLMWQHTTIWVKCGNSYLLTDNWTGQGRLLDFF